MAHYGYADTTADNFIIHAVRAVHVITWEHSDRIGVEVPVLLGVRLALCYPWLFFYDKSRCNGHSGIRMIDRLLYKRISRSLSFLLEEG